MNNSPQEILYLEPQNGSISLRKFNIAGIEAFRDFLRELRIDSTTPIAWELLQDPQFTELMTPEVFIQPKHLTTKADAAHYLEKILQPFPMETLRYHVGLWTWLTLFFFDSICPLKENLARTVRNDYCYICEPKNSHNFYRHYLYISWYVYRIAGSYSRLYLSSRIFVLDSITTAVMKRLFLTRIPCIFEVLDRLYWNPQTSNVRTGIFGTTRKGDLENRFMLRIRQLENTYDLPSLSADQLIELLGEEFDFHYEKNRKN